MNLQKFNTAGWEHITISSSYKLWWSTLAIAQTTSITLPSELQYRPFQKSDQHLHQHMEPASPRGSCLIYPTGYVTNWLRLVGAKLLWTNASQNRNASSSSSSCFETLINWILTYFYHSLEYLSHFFFIHSVLVNQIRKDIKFNIIRFKAS